VKLTLIIVGVVLSWRIVSGGVSRTGLRGFGRDELEEENDGGDVSAGIAGGGVSRTSTRLRVGASPKRRRRGVGVSAGIVGGGVSMTGRSTPTTAWIAPRRSPLRVRLAPWLR
jgi:hypothetical protein